MCLSNSDLEGLTVNYNDVDALDEVLHRCGVATIEGVNVDVVVLTNNLDEALTADDGYGSLVGIADDVLNAGHRLGGKHCHRVVGQGYRYVVGAREGGGDTQGGADELVVCTADGACLSRDSHIAARSGGVDECDYLLVAVAQGHGAGLGYIATEVGLAESGACREQFGVVLAQTTQGAVYIMQGAIVGVVEVTPDDALGVGVVA